MVELRERDLGGSFFIFLNVGSSIAQKLEIFSLSSLNAFKTLDNMTVMTVTLLSHRPIHLYSK